MAFLVSVGTDGTTDWVQTPDGSRYNLGPLSVLKFVTKLARPSQARWVLDQFLGEGQAMLAVDEERMWALLAPKRSRWAAEKGGEFPYGFVPVRLPMDIYEHLTRTERVVAYLDKKASFGETDPKAFEYLRKEAGKIQSPNQSDNSTYYGLGEVPVHEAADPAPEPHTVAASEHLQFDVYDQNMRLARKILDWSRVTVATIDSKVAAGRKFDSNRAKFDVHALTSKVASICEGTSLTEEWVRGDLQKLADRSKGLLRMFTGSRFGDLHDYKTGKYIRPATRKEQQDSRRAGPEGVIKVDGRSVYVED